MPGAIFEETRGTLKAFLWQRMDDFIKETLENFLEESMENFLKKKSLEYSFKESMEHFGKKLLVSSQILDEFFANFKGIHERFYPKIS